ncbi:potassium channel family protein [Flammeovirga sp. SJP92]|uniref:potassium channel family protein n=1 Tax=Flammeovirga sp. SJP92 TaxID=1775430 RepID=UPI000788A95C|nr:potassium channel family protein [Flammeovirga sp. SJP92]KXX68314.1 hypothetical protein AVL50_21255 [Flammeovirga sp. SJP92]
MIFNLFRKLRLHRGSEEYGNVKRIILYTLGINLLFAILFKYVEAVSWNEAIWQTWQTATTVGYGNRPAETLFGRIITMILSTVSIAFVGAMFSAVFDYKEYHKTQKKLGYMKNPFNDGYVIFNFPATAIAKNFIEELRAIEKDVGICFVDNNIEALPLEIQEIPNIHFVKGCPLQKNTYLNANINQNKTIIVFPNASNNSSADGATKTTVDLLERFVTEGTRILFVLVEKANTWMFDDNNATYINADLSVLAIVQECQDPYSAMVVEDLLYNTKGANPVTVEINSLDGIKWMDLQLKIMKASVTLNQQCNVIALIQNGKTDACPKPETVLNKGDLLSIATYSNFSWKEIEREILVLQD